MRKRATAVPAVAVLEAQPCLPAPLPAHAWCRLECELSSKAAALPPEPPATDSEAVSVAIRLPAGGRYSRRFLRTDTLQAVFDFVDVQSGGNVLSGTYSLATSYPRRVLRDGAAGQTLAEAGLTAKQEALFLEPK